MIESREHSQDMEDPVVHCARHPKTETALTCASCGTPICPKCMVVTPVGMKCPDCGTSKGMALFKVRPERLFLAGLTAFVAGIGAALAATAAFFFIFFIAAPYGYFAGSMILKASGMKRGLKLELVAGAGMVLGGIIFRIMMFGGVYSLLDFSSIWFWAVLVISTACAVSKIRFL